MEKNIEIFETAFVTSHFRASNIELSRDIYAHLWPTERTIDYHNEYVRKVSAHEPLAHCLRNRYFLDTIEKLFFGKRIELLINFGCGFSMYPFLLPNGMSHIEIDLADSIALKRKKVSSWQQTGRLPERNITYLSADFNADLNMLKAQVLKKKGRKKAFILLEGVLFFIGREDTDTLFSLFGQLQEPGELVGSVSFQKVIEQRKAFKKLEEFTKNRLNKNESFNYQTIEDSYYENLHDYRLVNHENTFSLAKTYGFNQHLEAEETLDEHFYILEKT